MLFNELTPIQRLSLMPWLPTPDLAPLAPEEAEILRQARDIAEDTDASPVPLQTPFAGLRVPAIGDAPGCLPPPVTYWPLSPAHPPDVRPPDISAVLRHWQTSVATLDLPPALSFSRQYATLMGLAQTHAACLALSGQPDIPLLQSRRLWSALAACLWTRRQEPDAPNELALLVADLSGIQSYLFGTSNFGVGGVARSLRARSFFLSQLTALFAWKLLEQLELPPGNLLLDAGGKFYLLFAPTPRALAAVEHARCEAAAWCLNALHGELALNVGVTRFPLTAFTDGSIARVWQAAQQSIAQAKQQKLRHALQTPDGQWNQAKFLRAEFHGDPCRACGRFAQVNAEKQKCALCLRDEEIGRRLTRAAWLAYESETASEPGPSHAKKGSGRDAISAFGWRVHAGGQMGQKEPLPPDGADWVAALDPALARSDNPLPLRRLARYVPTEADGQTPLTFDAMSKTAQGRPYLAYLKADVDRLGERFIFGYRHHDARHSLPRIGHLSHALDAFFSGWLEQTLRSDYKECYTVFAGGDDLTIIGPHDQILRLSRRLPRSFRRFLGYQEGTPNSADVLTLSAGIAIAHSRRPVATAVALAENGLEAAKHAGRCRVSLLNRTLTWDAYDQLLGQLWNPDDTETPFGAELLDSARTPSAFIYHLLRYARIWEEYGNRQWGQLRYQPLLAYDIGRNLDPRKTPHLHQWAVWLAQIHLTDSGDWRGAMDNLGVLARLVLLNRKGRDT